VSEPHDPEAAGPGPAAAASESERLALLARAARAILYEIDEKTGRIAWIEGKEAITGYPHLPSDTIQAWFDLVHPEDAQRVGDRIRSFLESGARALETEYRLRHRDGHYLHVLDRGAVLRDGGGRAVRVVGCTIDVSDRKAAEEAARERASLQERLSAVAAAVPGVVGTFEVAPDGRMRFAHLAPSAEEHYGLPLTTLTQDLGPMLARIHPEDAAAVQATTLLAARDLTLWRERYRYRHPVKGERIFQTWSRPRREPDGRVLFDGVTMDVTDQEAARLALEERERRLATVLQTALDGFWVIDPGGRILEVNDAYCAMSGYGRAELLRLRIPDIEAVESRADVGAHIGRILERGAERFESRHRRKDGSTFDVEVSARTLSGNMMCFIRDVTEHRRAEAELRRSREELRTLAAQLQATREREMGRIARDLHDDLGQALTGLQLDLRGVEQELEALLPADARSGPILDRLVAASELAQATLHTVQRIALDLRPASLDQLGLAGALRQEARRFTQRTGLPVEHRLEVERRPADEVATALYRICQEALTNVARHAQASRVEVRLREEEGALLLEVEDDGRGLPVGGGTPRSSMGILGMEERAASMGGWLRLGSGTLGGTLVVARIPAGPEGAPE
jgi:PAS domain S-box-containing protein